MGIEVSVKFELDNGKTKKYATWWTEYYSEGYYPDEPYHTKCGLSFKKDPKDGACGHLDCAMGAAKTEAIGPVAMFCLFSIMMIAAGWYEKKDLFTGFQDAEGFIMVFGPIMLLMSIFPFRRWLELNEYKKHGTIHGRTARRL
jgi:hypothetical protein